MIYIGSLHCILTKDLLTVDISITLYNVKVALRKPYCLNTFLKHNYYKSQLFLYLTPCHQAEMRKPQNSTRTCVLTTSDTNIRS